MTDRVSTADEAVEIGLINKAAPTEDPHAEVDDLVDKLESYDYSTLRIRRSL